MRPTLFPLALLLASTSVRAQTPPPPVTARWDATFYGFAELDSIYDSTESYADLAGNAPIARTTSYAGRRPRAQMSVRNSRLGFRLATPVVDGVGATGVIETDFYGNAPPAAGQAAGGVSEAGFFSNPGLRVRHAFLKLETPIVDVLAGQTWQLFGWNAMFEPCTTQNQGVSGEVFARQPQIRITKTLKTQPLNIELAVAAARPPERDSAVPDGQAGGKLTFNGWKGVHTMNGAITAVDGLTVAVSGALRRFTALPGANRPYGSWANGWGVSLDALVPVLPGTLDSRANALTLTGSFVRGRGIADLYVGLTGGLTSPSAFGTSPGVDAGLVALDANDVLQTVQWQSFIVGVQYYLPPSGSLWVSANYSEMKSDDIADLAGAANAAKVFTKSRWYDANLFWDAATAVRFGVEYARTEQTYADSVSVHNNRVELASYFLF